MREIRGRRFLIIADSGKSDLLRSSDLHRSTGSECLSEENRAGSFAETWNVPERMHKAHFTPPQFPPSTPFTDLTHRQTLCPHCQSRSFQAFFEAFNLKKGNLKKEEEILSISIKTVCNEMRVLFNRAMVNKWMYVTMTATRNNHIRDVEILEKFSWDDPPRGSTVYRSSNLPLTAMLSGLLGDNGVRRRK